MSSVHTSHAAHDRTHATARNTVTVLLFARAAELLEADQVSLDMDVGSTVGDVERRLRELPGGSRLPAGSRIAVNQKFAEPNQPVHAGDEVAVIPPVAGG